MRRKRQTILDYIHADVDAKIAEHHAKIAELQRQKELLKAEEKAYEQQRVARRAGASSKSKAKRSDVTAIPQAAGRAAS